MMLLVVICAVGRTALTAIVEWDLIVSWEERAMATKDVIEGAETSVET